MTSKQYISWRRVSTFKQNRSGLGLEAQKEIIRYFVERDGGKLIADFSECYTGKELSGCKELRKAMAYAKETGAILVIAKSDRFRNCQEALGILDEMGEGNIEFCDLPHSDRFTLTLFWALAEREALITSIRTKQALAAKKARGELLGGLNEKWQETYKQKTIRQRHELGMKRGQTKNRRFLEREETRCFIRIIKNVFPDETMDDDMSKWYWKGINTKEGNRQRVIALMRDYHEMDSNLFRGWDFTEDLDSVELQVKLATKINGLRRSIKKLYQFKEESKEEQDIV